MSRESISAAKEGERMSLKSWGSAALIAAILLTVWMLWPRPEQAELVRERHRADFANLVLKYSAPDCPYKKMAVMEEDQQLWGYFTKAGFLEKGNEHIGFGVFEKAFWRLNWPERRLKRGDMVIIPIAYPKSMSSNVAVEPPQEYDPWHYVSGK